MNREDRAKQFAPFDALKGLREALFKKELERERQQKKDLSEEDLQEIQGIILKTTKGSLIRLTYYEHGYYRTITNTIDKIDYIFRYLKIAGKTVLFNDIFQIKLM